MDPDESLVYTRRKLRLLQQGRTGHVHDATPEPPLQIAGCSDTMHTKKVSFPGSGWVTSLENAPMFTRAEIDEHIANSGKKFDDSEHHSLPTGLRKARAFLEDEYLHQITFYINSDFVLKSTCTLRSLAVIKNSRQPANMVRRNHTIKIRH